MVGSVKVVGLTDFRKALKNTDPAMGKALGRANKSAAEFVAAEARTRAGRRGGAANKGKRSIKARGAQAKAAIAIGGARAPYMLGAEFGAHPSKFGFMAKRAGPPVRQFPKWRGNGWMPDELNGVGYFLHPAIRDTRRQFEQIYLEKLDEVAADAFPDP